MYYLQSRYYNPEWGRFINADVFVSTGQGLLGNNMFAYCRNNPVSRVDASGTLDLECEDDTEDLTSGKMNDWTRGGPTQEASSRPAAKGAGGRGSFRNKLKNLTGQDGKGSDAHHVFPYAFADLFAALGIDVNRPEYGAWWETHAHRQNSYAYNSWWKGFFSIKGVTAQDAFALADYLAHLYGFLIG